MRIRHNKKRNTAFVYESLIKEITLAILKEDVDRKTKAIDIVRKHFTPETSLFKHLQCYRSLYENQSLSREISEKILKEAKQASRLLDPEGLFKQQTALIKDINKTLSPSVFNNFVPNYKTLASINQIFYTKLSPKNTVILESLLVDNMTRSPEVQGPREPIDNLVLGSFVQKFNIKYGDTLAENQKQLMNLYITSFADNSLSLKVYLNSEIARLKGKVMEAIVVKEIQSDPEMVEKTKRLMTVLESFKNRGITDDVILTVLRTQAIAQEIFEHDQD
jgi:hypothetical protein|tara:strand:+ start:6892 stop:7722 length:831 start_codon:yes stop_codon:yes gene_type:complete